VHMLAAGWQVATWMMLDPWKWGFLVWAHWRWGHWVKSSMIFSSVKACQKSEVNTSFESREWETSFWAKQRNMSCAAKLVQFENGDVMFDKFVSCRLAQEHQQMTAVSNESTDCTCEDPLPGKTMSWQFVMIDTNPTMFKMQLQP